MKKWGKKIIPFDKGLIMCGALTMILATIFSGHLALAERPVISWIKQLGTSDGDDAQSVAVGKDGSVLITGYTSGTLDGNTSAGLNDVVIAKYDMNGNRIWARQFGTPGYDIGRSVAVDGSGNSFITGSVDGSLDSNPYMGQPDIFLAKYDANGNKLWTWQYRTLGWDDGIGVAVDGNGNIFVSGTTEGPPNGESAAGTDLFLAKFDTNGNRLWTRQFGTPPAYSSGFAVAVDVSGNVIVTGYTSIGLHGNASAGSMDIFLAKYDTNGNRLWTKQHGSSDYDYPNGLATDGDGNIFVTGHTFGSLDGNTNAGFTDMFLLKYDNNGNRLWTRQLGTPEYDYGDGVAVDGSGNVFVTGYAGGSLQDNTSAVWGDILLVKYDTDGNRIWASQFGTDRSDHGHGIAFYHGNIFVTGFTDANFDGNSPNRGEDMVLLSLVTMFGPPFLDVPPIHLFFQYIDAIAAAGLTAGCEEDDPATSNNEAKFCPDTPISRGQMAVFIETSLGNPPSACAGRFGDVSLNSPFCGFIEKLADDGITGGCSATNFCPDDPVTRGQMAVFIEAALENPASICTGRFTDVPIGHPFCGFIERLSDDGITGGCGGGNFCPNDPVTRGQMAVFLVAAPTPLDP